MAIEKLADKDEGQHSIKGSGIANALSSLDVAESLQLLELQLKESSQKNVDGFDKAITKLITSNERLSDSNELRSSAMNRLTGGLLLVAVLQLFVSIILPWWQEMRQEHSEIQSVYQAIDANEDIFIDNYNELKSNLNRGLPVVLPQTFIELPISDKAHKTIQGTLGIDLYRYFLFYLNQTKLLDQQIDQVRQEIAKEGAVSNVPAIISAYWLSLENLDKGGWESKFNYIHDASCLEYIFVKSFSFLKISERSKTTTCSSESLNRIFGRYGYVESEMPKWLLPELRVAINEREQGMGDRLIGN